MTLRAVLAGAGHAHLQLIAEAGALRRAGVDPALIAPAVFRYSGMASGVLSGALAPSEAEIDVAALARHNGVDHIVSEVASVDRASRTLTLTGGGTIEFDALSMNVGSVVSAPVALREAPGMWPVKPLSNLFALRRHLEERFAAERNCPPLVVAGRGPTGYEIAAAMAGLCERHGIAPDVTLAGPAESWAPRMALEQLSGSLTQRGVAIIHERVEGMDGECALLHSGRQLPCSALLLATGLAAPPLMASLGLPVDAQGRLVTTDALNAASDAGIFATGDCGTIAGAARPFVGVFGVRAAATLGANLGALAQSKPLRSYRPQSRWLTILDLGDGTGLAMRGNLWWLGRAPLALKRRIDRRFIARFRRPA